MCCNCNRSCWDSCGGCGCGSSAGCGCGCGSSAGTGTASGCGCGNNGAVTLPGCPGQGWNDRYPVYVSVPAFLRRPVAASEVVADANWGCLY